MTEDAETLLDRDQWKSLGEWLRENPSDERRERVTQRLRSLGRLVTQVACVFDFGLLRDYLFIPFGGPDLWNRRIVLWVMYLEAMDSRHFGLSRFTVLFEEHLLSGLAPVWM